MISLKSFIQQHLRSLFCVTSFESHPHIPLFSWTQWRISGSIYISSQSQAYAHGFRGSHVLQVWKIFLWRTQPSTPTPWITWLGDNDPPPNSPHGEHGLEMMTQSQPSPCLTTWCCRGMSHLLCFCIASCSFFRNSNIISGQLRQF